jgi:tryptophan halogenase
MTGGKSLPRKVVVVGRDVAAWLSANMILAALAPAGVAVEVVELPGQLRPADVYAALPPLEALHRLLGFDENEVLRATKGTFSLGQSLANFSGTRPAFFHPYGSVGNGIAGLSFAQFWIKARQAGLRADFEDFSLNAAAAKQGRFFTPTASLSTFGRFDYGYHLCALPYVQFLRAKGLKRGVTVRPARHVDARLDPRNGHIRSLVLGDGSEVGGDLFIDATGSESLLLGRALDTPFESWETWFPNDRVLTVAGDRLKAMPAYGQTRALATGMLHLAPVQDATCLTHVYHSEHLQDDVALENALAISGLRPRSAATVSPLVPGIRTAAWAGNCIGVGEAACVFNPVDNPGLHSLHLGLVHLLNLFPVDGQVDLDAAEYNRITRTSYERLRNFQLCHFQLNRNFALPYWDYLRETPVPDELAAKYALFKARGDMVMYDDETFQADDWLSVFIGHGLMPDSYDPRVDQTPDADAIGHFQAMLRFIREEVDEMSSHAAYLELHASAEVS